MCFSTFSASHFISIDVNNHREQSKQCFLVIVNIAQSKAVEISTIDCHGFVEGGDEKFISLPKATAVRPQMKFQRFRFRREFFYNLMNSNNFTAVVNSLS